LKRKKIRKKIKKIKKDKKKSKEVKSPVVDQPTSNKEDEGLEHKEIQQTTDKETDSWDSNASPVKVEESTQSTDNQVVDSWDSNTSSVKVEEHTHGEGQDEPFNEEETPPNQDDNFEEHTQETYHEDDN